MSSIARVFSERILPVARGLDHVAAPPLVDALRAGGISSIEITVEAVGGIEAIAAVSRGEMKVGAGSVATIDQARKAVDAGAEFLVMPHLDIELVQWSRINDVALVPGGLTPNEIHAAWRNSPPAVKLFPAHVGGPQYLQSLLAPYPDLRLIPTGGIDGDNIRAYLDAGAVAVGVGGWLTAHPDLSVVTERARQLVAQVV